MSISCKHTGALLANPYFMNNLLIGTADKTEQLLQLTKRPFLLIDDGPIADAFLDAFPKTKLFDVTAHSFNPLKGMDYKRARDFVAALYTASPEGENTLTVRNGKRAMVQLLLANTTRLDKLPPASSNDPGMVEAVATIEDVLLSPVLSRVLCEQQNFWFKGSIVAKLDRAQLGDFDAFVLASLLIGQFQGQIIVPDFGFYGRDFYMSLIRQDRLIAGVNYLAELSPSLRQNVLLIKDKTGAHCTYEDAETLASYASLTPNTVAHTDFVQSLVE